MPSDMDSDTGPSLDEAWANASEALQARDPEGMIYALSELCAPLQTLASDPSSARCMRGGLERVFTGRSLLLEQFCGDLEGDLFTQLSLGLSLLLVAAKHIGLHMSKEEYIPILEQTTKHLRELQEEKEKSAESEAPKSIKKNTSTRKRYRLEEDDSKGLSDSEEESEMDEDDGSEGISECTDTLSLLLHSSKRSDTIWLYHEFLRKSVFEHGWSCEHLYVFQSFFGTLAKVDYEDLEGFYGADVVLEDFVRLLEQVSTMTDATDGFIEAVIDTTEAFVDIFTVQLKEKDGKLLVDALLKFMQSAVVSSNAERVERLSNMFFGMYDLECVWLWPYSRELLSSSYKQVMEMSVSHETFVSFLHLAEHVFSLREDNQETIQMMIKLLAKCFDAFEEVMEDSASSEDDEELTMLCDSFLSVLLLGFVAIPFSEQLTTRFIELTRIEKLRYPRKVSEKTLARLLHEMCGGFLGKIKPESTEMFFLVRGTTMPVSIANILVDILLKIPDSSLCLRGKEGDAKSGVSVKGILNYARFLSEAQNVGEEGTTVVPLNLAELAVRRHKSPIWSRECIIRDEWPGIRQIVELATLGTRGHECHADECDCDCSCDCESEDDDAKAIRSAEMLRRLVKTIVLQDIAPIEQVCMMLVKMKVPKLRASDDIQNIEKHCHVALSLYLTCMKHELAIEPDFFKTYIHFFLNKSTKDYEKSINKVAEEIRRISKGGDDSAEVMLDLESMMKSLNEDGNNVARICCLFLDKMHKILPRIEASRKEGLQQDINMLDQLLLRLLRVMSRNKNSMNPCSSYASESKHIPASQPSLAYALSQLPKSIKDMKGDEYSSNESSVIDMIEVYGSLICNENIHTGAEQEKVFEALLEQYEEAILCDEDVLQFPAAHNLTHMPLLLASLKRGEWSPELWNRTIAEMRRIKNLDSLIHFGRCLSQLPAECIEKLGQLDSKPLLTETLRFATRCDEAESTKLIRKEIALTKGLLEKLE